MPRACGRWKRYSAAEDDDRVAGDHGLLVAANRVQTTDDLFEVRDQAVVEGVLPAQAERDLARERRVLFSGSPNRNGRTSGSEVLREIPPYCDPLESWAELAER